MLLLEAANDYFSYEPVLKALQASNEATLPFSHLLRLSPDQDVSHNLGLEAISLDWPAQQLRVHAMCELLC